MSDYDINRSFPIASKGRYKMDINKDSIGHKLREIRVLNGLTVSQMADKLGISYDHWRLVDQGKDCQVWIF